MLLSAVWEVEIILNYYPHPDKAYQLNKLRGSTLDMSSKLVI